jgi:hypothetical protein
MDNMLNSILQNLNLDGMKLDDSMFNNCLHFLSSSSLSEEQYEMISEVCQEKIEELQSKKYISNINEQINELKTKVDTTHPFYDYLNNVYELKAYINDENEISDPTPSLEYVVETNYQTKNITFFYEVVFDNIAQKINNIKFITIKLDNTKVKEKDTDNESDEEDMSTSSESEDENTIDIDGENYIDDLIKHMNWPNTQETTEYLQFFLNSIFNIFDSEINLEW